jgi:hypothetical protein
MDIQAVCPYCQTPAAQRCAHLALAAAPRDFVRECIGRSHGAPFWQRLTTGQPREDFLWLETAFAERFLKPLPDFGALEYEWRTVEHGGARDLWVLLWSPRPANLWWELRDTLDAHAHKIIPLPVITRTARCPLCQLSASVGCEHLLIQGEDLAAADLVSLFHPQGAWNRLLALRPDAPAEAATFLKRYTAHFTSVVSVERRPWHGENLGFRGDDLLVWVRSLGAFEREMSAFLKPS